MLNVLHSTRFLAVMLAGVASTLGGCVTGSEVSYSEYQYNPYSGTERVYEHSLSVDPRQGAQTETCRTTIRRHVAPFGGEFDRRVQVCDEAPGGYGGEPLSPDNVPQSVYRSPDSRPLPQAVIPGPTE